MIYNCECGHDQWKVHGELLECAKCGRHYYHLMDQDITQHLSQTVAVPPDIFNKEHEHYAYTGKRVNGKWKPIKVKRIRASTKG